MNAWAGLEEESPMFVASLVGGGAPQWSQHFHNVQLSTVVICYKLCSPKKEIQEFRWHFGKIIFYNSNPKRIVKFMIIKKP